MKLKFSVRYRTAWGESLHVSITYHRQDGSQRSQDLPMLTDDGELWTLETSALMSRQHPLSHIVYCYQVEDDEQRVLRREWNMIPRLYHFDATSNYIFIDAWRDRPLPLHLYSAAYLTTVGQRREEQVEALRLPLFRRTVVFRVSAPQVLRSQSVAVCGSHPAIGSWNPSRYLKMDYAGDGEWTLSVNALGWLMPVEYKYVVVDEQTHELQAWEEGDNRVIDTELADGQVLVVHGGHLRLCERQWRAAGVAVPVFALRSEHSYGVGDFGDLRRLVDWAVAAGMKVIQVLPVGDTTTDGRWLDSDPYSITSAFALHPHYVDLEAAGTLRDKARMTQFLRRRQELNALPYSDYEAVDRVKREYLEALFREQGEKTLASQAFRDFFAANEDWLKPYADSSLFTFHSSLIYFTQYLLHTQLKAAADYARQQGVVLKGDLPIGVRRNSVEVAAHPHLFHLDCQAGTPPDARQPGQNWGFPTYNWNNSNEELRMKNEESATAIPSPEGTAAANSSLFTLHSSLKDSSLFTLHSSLPDWFHRRLRHMQQYFDALRIDHVLGFFRIWEIPIDAVDPVLGHFSPALPLTVSEIEYFGLAFRKELFTRPFINDRLVERLFGIHAQHVREHFLTPKAYGLYDLRPDYDTQRKVDEAFSDRHDESSLWIRDGLMRLLADVLFVEDPRQPEMYHPRINIVGQPIYEALSAEDKDSFVRLYNNYYYQRHNFFWRQQALQRLPQVFGDCRMLLCAEDLGMLPDCVEPVLDELRILSLEIQQMPKQQGFDFAHLEANPIRSVCTTSTHDMAPLRLWWQEQPERRQRYWVTMLQKEGRAPEQLPAHVAEEIVARHLYCPSMLCILPLQDWLAIDGELRRKQPAEERINTPSDAYNRWQWRMHLTIEQLLEATKYNNKVKTMIQRSKR